MKRLLVALAIGYVALALFYRAQESMGQLRCDCDPDCWCQQPGLSLFRWVFPRYHRNRELAAWKRAQFG